MDTDNQRANRYADVDLDIQARALDYGLTYQEAADVERRQPSSKPGDPAGRTKLERCLPGRG